MHASLLLLDAALELATLEVAALANEDDELLERLIRDREALMDEAWEKRQGCSEELMLERIVSLQEIHEHLCTQVRRLTQEVRATLQDNKKESSRLTGYQATVRRPIEAHYISCQG